MNYSDFDLYDNLPKEAIKIAESNGISKQLARQRFNYGWSAERAITEPNNLKKNQARKYLEKAVQEAKENGIELEIMNVQSRLNQGWPHKDIVNTPIGVSRKTINELFDLAYENGIKKVTYKGRRQRGWTPEEAATIPVKKQFRHKGSWNNEVLFNKKEESK